MSGKSSFIKAAREQKASVTLFERIGGTETVERLSRAFYARVEADPLLRPMFRKDLDRSRDLQALFLAEALGGPKGFSRRRKTTGLKEIHAAHRIGPEHVAAWLGHMEAAMSEVGIKGRERANLRCYFHDGADALGDPLDECYDLPTDELKARLVQNPSLVTARGRLGWTLLHHAAGRWDTDRVRLLLEHGAEARDSQSHSPLYAAANRLAPLPERDSPAGREVVETLVRHGAEVNARSGAGEQTALHMAARRGNTAVAGALLDAGAEIEARDTKGETPLRRAVNCRHQPVVRLLMERGANPHAPDRRGVTPVMASRQPGFLELLGS
jgi:hemoglobin